ncbi:MAG: pyridoxal-phosphate dependent enzyme [Burkholderiales bacterium]
MADLALPDIAAIRQARVRIASHVRVTPVMRSEALDAVLGAQLYLKCENFQKVGAFKARGACNAVFALSEEVARRGVVTHSSGNHGAALAYAAQRRGIPAHVVMPDNAPKVKVDNVESFGAKVHFCAANVPAREATCAEVERTTGAVLVHPYDNFHVIAGQGTAALEMLEAHPEIEVVVTPVGGGGLMSGTAIATHGMNARIVVVGTEPAGADDASRSFASGRVEPMDKPQTIADGLRSTVSERTLTAMRAHLASIATCSEGAIVAAMRLVWERVKIVIEPSSAVPLAAMLEGTLDVRGKRVGVVLTGGNVDLDRLPWQR